MWQVIRYESQGNNNKSNKNKTWSQTNGKVYVGALAEAVKDNAAAAKGAESVSKFISAYLIDQFDDILKEERLDQRKIDLLAAFRHALGVIADEMDCSLNDLACSVHAAAIRNDSYLSVSIGDGMIVLEKEKALEPAPGRSAKALNILSSGAPFVLNLNRGNLGELDGFIIMSDQLKDAWYNKENRTLSDPLYSILDSIDTFTPETAHQKLREKIIESVGPESENDVGLVILREKASTRGSKTFPLPNLSLGE